MLTRSYTGIPRVEITEITAQESQLKTALELRIMIALHITELVIIFKLDRAQVSREYRQRSQHRNPN